ncbi:MAG TPA: DUF488 domain-containing protein [Pseudolabrys sp.]|nr:DUF488 domain-containing protein [Pseudolabrys sp.]
MTGLDRQAFFTIGHSTRPLAVFVELLHASRVGLVVDVRTVPRSRTNPQYNLDTLPEQLSHDGIAYRHIAALGGLRGKAHDVAVSENAFWTNDSFHNYADYALSAAFRSGFDELRDLGHETAIAIMCAEAVWWRCHRRIITDYLIVAGESVFHILDKNHVEAARLTPAARPDSSGAVRYPADATPVAGL